MDRRGSKGMGKGKKGTVKCKEVARKQCASEGERGMEGCY